VQTTRVEYYHNDVKLTFPLAAPITTRVKHVYCVGGWKSCKWGPPPNMDGTPSSEGLHSTAILPSAASTSTTRVADSSTSSTTAKSAGASFSTFSAPTTTKPVDAVANAKKVPASQGQPANSVRSTKKASNMPVLSHTAATLPTSSVQPENTTGKPLNKSRNMGGGFVMVSATGFDDDFFGAFRSMELQIPVVLL
jgi:hypothetical protein